MRCTGCTLVVPTATESRCPVCGDPVRIEAKELLGPGGIVKETRAPQIEAAEVIEEAYAAAKHAIIEAGVGTGKSFAYLIPAIISNTPGQDRKHRTVVSTATIGLQSQLVEKDLPFLQKALAPYGYHFTYAVAKGKGNYVCEAAVTAAATDSFSPVKFDPVFLKFARDSISGGSGDKAEVASLPQEWPSVTAEECVGKSCSKAATCGYMKARLAMQEANVVVANHSLVGIDMQLSTALRSNPLLGQYNALILDEAHKAGDYIRKAFSSEAAEDGIHNIHKGVRKLHLPDYNADDWKHLTDLIRRMFVYLPSPKGTEAYATVTPQTLGKGYGTLLTELDVTRLKVLKEANADVAKVDSKLEAKNGPVSEADFKHYRKCKRQVRALNEYCNALKDVATLVDNNWIAYVSLEDQKKKKLVITPISVAPMLAGILYPTTPTVVATSATMSVTGSFDSIKEELGLRTAPQFERQLKSPFSYMQAAVLYCPDTVPEAPDANDATALVTYAKAVAAEVKKLTDVTNGRAFVLFTSRIEMDKVYDYLMPLRLNLLKQDPKVNTPSALLEQFRLEAAAGKAPVLLGLKSFWEGISVEGDDLSCVIVVKLPFPNKSEPIYNALCEKAGTEWFQKVALPQMIKELQQGTGRLIRTTTDVGIVSILDKRMYTKSYGSRTILPTLPFTNRTADIEDVRSRYNLIKQLRDSRVAQLALKKSA
jgi:ATP-dependent DNA helicase DinG